MLFEVCSPPVTWGDTQRLRGLEQTNRYAVQRIFAPLLPEPHEGLYSYDSRPFVLVSVLIFVLTT